MGVVHALRRVPSSSHTQQSWHAPMRQNPARGSPLASFVFRLVPDTRMAASTVRPAEHVAGAPLTVKWSNEPLARTAGMSNGCSAPARFSSGLIFECCLHSARLEPSRNCARIPAQSRLGPKTETGAIKRLRAKLDQLGGQDRTRLIEELLQLARVERRSIEVSVSASLRNAATPPELAARTPIDGLCRMSRTC